MPRSQFKSMSNNAAPKTNGSPAAQYLDNNPAPARFPAPKGKVQLVSEVLRKDKETKGTVVYTGRQIPTLYVPKAVFPMSMVEFPSEIEVTIKA